MSDHAPFSEDLMIMLGAYVNGTLTADECQTVEEMAANDPSSAAELESLFLLNTDLNSAMDSLLDMPIPPKTAQFATPAPMPANTNAAPLRALAASLVIGAALGAAGMWFSQSESVPTQRVASARSWLAEVAEYHQVYAKQTRHLVEVPASEQAHIESWLSKEIGVDFKVLNLSDAGWTFQGARLLVAAGKPVAQMMYTNAEGAVIALCGLQNGSGTTAEPALHAFGDVHMATWKSTT